MLAIVALWGVPALIQTHGEFFRIGIGRHVVGRSFGAMEGHGANSLGVYLLLLPFYFVTIFASFFPWSIKLPALAKKTLARTGQDRHLPDFRHRSHLCYFLTNQNKAAALHPSGISAAFASARAPPGRSPAISETICPRRGVDLSRRCAFHCTIGRAILPSHPAFATNTRSASAGNGIRRGRFPGAKFGLVFSVANQRLDDSVKFSERCTIHGERRSALCDSADHDRSQDISGSSCDVEKFFYHTRFQHRQRQRCRSYACVEAGLRKRCFA